MRVINVSSERRKIRKGTELAICEPIVSVTPSQPTNEDREKTLMEPLPDHLKPLLKKSVESLSEEQSKQVSTNGLPRYVFEGTRRSWTGCWSQTQDRNGRGDTSETAPETNSN